MAHEELVAHAAFTIVFILGSLTCWACIELDRQLIRARREDEIDLDELLRISWTYRDPLFQCRVYDQGFADGRNSLATKEGAL